MEPLVFWHENVTPNKGNLSYSLKSLTPTRGVDGTQDGVHAKRLIKVHVKQTVGIHLEDYKDVEKNMINVITIQVNATH